MNTRISSLAEALHPRACAVAEVMADRLPDAGLWQGYKRTEPLQGELRLKNLLVYKRRQAPQAVLVFRNPAMTQIQKVHWDDPAIVDTNVERHRSSINIDKPVLYSETLTHTFTETQSVEDQLKAGIEVGLKAGFEAGSEGGIHGITAKVYAELTVKLSASIQHTKSKSTESSNTVTRHIEVQGPIHLDWEAKRSINKETANVVVDCDYDHSVELIDERQGMKPDNRPNIQIVIDNWATFKAIIQQFAPSGREVERNGRKEIEPTPLYHEFIDNPLLMTDLDRLIEPPNKVVQMLLQYDNVVSQTITII